MNLLEKFHQYWSVIFPNVHKNNVQLLVAVSGGVDSIVLCDVLHKTEFQFSIAHCNFQLRGAESDRDEQFVRTLSTKYQVLFYHKKFDTQPYAIHNKLSIQEAARKLRYEWFSELLITKFPKDIPAYIVTAHQADDNVETVLMNIFRGTGIGGLHGILPIQGSVIRPLLFTKRTDILEYARANQLEWVEDSSNKEDKYTRNFFRHQLIPLVKEAFPQAEQNIVDNIERWKEVEQVYDAHVVYLKKQLLQIKGEEVHISVLKLRKMYALKTIVFELTKVYGFTSKQTNDVMALLNTESGKYITSSTHRIIRNRAWLIISPLHNERVENILIDAIQHKIDFEAGKLSFQQIERTAFTIPAANNIACLNADEIEFPLLLRKWKQGDYFYPLGMRKKKKLSRFFIDQKLSLTQKENTWVLESNKKIFWIVGNRIDDRFKVTSSTINILKISFQPC